MKSQPWVSQLLLVCLVLALNACSGGAATTSNPSPQTVTSASYAGPAPATADVQAFRINLWQNINGSNRCGNCHKAGGQSPMFARSDDVNLAYNDALGVVNLSQPDQSRMVIKVAGGHNCWLASPQACADILTTWIKNWAGGVSSGGTQIQLVAPADKTVGSTKVFPASANDNGNASFAQTVYPLLSQFCSRCHSASATTPQTPYFASSDVDEAYAAAQAKINLDTPSLSRFYVRLHDESHNCWVAPGDVAVSCPKSSATMLAAIQAFVDGIVPTQVDPALVLSKALTLYDGTIASGGNRYDTGVIAKWQFKEGMGTIADDTSGVDPALNLTLAGDTSWVGGWGVSFGPNGGEARGGAASRKLYDSIKNTGEFSVELWVAPANVTQEDAYMASYSGGTAARNFTMGQHAYQYEMFNRSSATDANGSPSLLTSDVDRDAQASLQHVVLTYDAVNGRRLYVNGNYTGDADPEKGGTLGNWDDTFVLLLGNETSGNRKWQGTLRFAAVYNRALTQEQIQQNFAAGVGERYFLLFNVSALTGVNQAYVMFEVSRYDSYSYLFTKPTFISLDSMAKPGSIPIKGMRIGVNGAEAKVGQAYAPLDTTVTDSNYTAGVGQLLSPVGTVIALEKGPDSDLFFLSFDQIGSSIHVRTDPAVPQPATPADKPESSQYGVRVFGEINATLADITGVSMNDPGVLATYALVEQQLPTVPTIESFVASHQIGMAQLAIQYCDALVESGQAGSFFPGLQFNAPPATAFADTSLLIDPLLARGVGINLATQPADSDVRAELNSLVTRLSSCGAGCAPDRTKTITKAACATVLGSAAVLIK
ncbi:MAG TPA: LamG domain-containing protein [Steroidobacteraceae bacterium]|nr:LamG domain-containing protein [Steroidobacteraceae bacterium]